MALILTNLIIIFANAILNVKNALKKVQNMIYVKLVAMDIIENSMILK